MAADLDGVLETRDRRTGFVDKGLPADHDDVEGVPEGEVSEDASLYMGFKSGFTENQAPEDAVTIQSGPFAGGYRLRGAVPSRVAADAVQPLPAADDGHHRDGSTVFESGLSAVLHPEAVYHYGTVLEALESGDEVTLSPGAPSQVARHEGYETAFLEMGDVSMTVP